ncbi:type II toxin-antitoxin system HigB family toxin [Persicobacter sp. CCB-QB2]|uniref:type II toxin-antitoxin system HigB family toxin n=1 Tax=Persicobacter sp. CCB-QB2 TaxID=1561025 RepID=UPI0006A969B4|nr:type II toxin-antitoxin system HigB family toxin [Persicobacter sp. CCB-QB2]
MRVHLIKRQTVEDYMRSNASSKAAFEAWLMAIRYADWYQPQDILCTFNSVDILGKGSDRVIFNIGGNSHRMICKYLFGRKVHLFVKWIGTHAEYDKICKRGLQYSISEF